MKKVAVYLGDPGLDDVVKHGGKFNQEDIEVVEILKDSIGLLGGYDFHYYDRHSSFHRVTNLLKKWGYDYAFNLCDEGFRNDASKEAEIPEMLEYAGIPYTGAGPECLRLCYDKTEAKEAAAAAGIPVAEGVVIGPGQRVFIPYFGLPAIVKPNSGDGSFAINSKAVVRDEKSLEKQVDYVRKCLDQARREPQVLVEKYLPGNEITAAIIGNGNDLKIKLLEEDFGRKKNRTIHNDDKWNRKKWNRLSSIAPTIDLKTRSMIAAMSGEAFRAAGCRDYARFDWRLDGNGAPFLIEINPNCGWCHDGHLAKAYMLGSSDPRAQAYAYLVLLPILQAAEKRFHG